MSKTVSRRPFGFRLFGMAGMAAAAGYVGLGVSPAEAVVTVTPSSNAAALANAFANSQVTIVGTPTLQGMAGQQGTFTSTNASTVGFGNGVVLTSGAISNIPGPNSSSSSTGVPGSGTDADLQSIATDTVSDANVLTFQFQVAANTGGLTFQYVFASEEYNSFVGTNVNDVFGFFVDGKNVALIPGTNTPVSINTVNGGNTATAASNSQFYINNSLSTDPPASGTPAADPTRLQEFGPDGLTTVLTANVLAALNPNLTTHTIKLAVGDVGDSQYDSDVFLRSQSFGTPEPSTALLAVVAGAGLMRRRRA